jgi:HlyD family secretion protein
VAILPSGFPLPAICSRDAVFVDDNDVVKKGQVIARLDTRKLRDQVAQSKASLTSAKSAVLQAQATEEEARANLARLEHVAQLSGGKVPSKAELDTAKATLKRAQANTASAEASISQVQAALQSAETNVELASIRSPIDGIVLSRQIEPGQTVASQFQAPVLFTLAENLSQMKLEVNVDEADVGQVKPGQPASFSVDAWPGRQYPSEITRVGFGALEEEGVVSYKTVLTVNNDDLSLRPGMTATAEITTQQRSNVLLVPNAALRFSPPVPEEKKPSSGGLVASLMPRFGGQRPQQKARDDNTAQLWTLQNKRLVPIDVVTGVSDGNSTEIRSGGLVENMQVVTDIKSSGR